MKNFWFIEEGYFAKYQAAVALDYVPKISEAKLGEIRANADLWAKEGYANDNLVNVNGEAHIQVHGVLLESASIIDELYAKYLGEQYSTYAGIEAQIEAAENNAFVHKIVFDIDSPGGVMAGVDNTAMCIATATKPTEARVGWMAASAAYYLASQAGSITAKNPTSSVGSIGVVVDLVDVSKAYEAMGVKQYSLTSTAAPKKRPEPHSDEFKAQVVGRLDELHGIFASRVAEGRTNATGNNISVEQVNKTFGEGGMVIATEALELGMIDKIADMSSKTKEVGMTEQEQVSVDARVEAAHTAGVEQERARVAALLPWMDADAEGVTKAITDGEEVSHKMIVQLSAKAAEKAKTDAVASAKADEEARITAAADTREEDDAPEIKGEEPADEKTGDEKVTDELYAAVQKRKGVK